MNVERDFWMIDKDKIWIFFMKLFYGTCHQKADRSFFVNNYQFPICARCTGLLIGYILGIISIFFNFKISILLSVFFIVIMFVDWFIQHKNILYFTNIRKLLTGLFCGLELLISYLLVILKF